MKLVDGNDRELPPGEAGEIVVRAPNVAKGYLKRPEATAEAFRGGWFYTGDIGRMDEHGYLYLLDRRKDLIITGGELVYSLEVESALYKNPKVLECAVFGIPDEAYGEALLAAIVPTAGESPTAEELIEHCRAHIGGYCDREREKSDQRTQPLLVFDQRKQLADFRLLFSADHHRDGAAACDRSFFWARFLAAR